MRLASAKIRNYRTKGGQDNALDDPGAYVTRSAANGVFPTIDVSTVPAELIMTRGAASYEPIAGHVAPRRGRTPTTTSSSIPPPASSTSSSRGGGSRRSRSRPDRGRTSPTTSCPRRSPRSRHPSAWRRAPLGRGHPAGAGGRHRQQHSRDGGSDPGHHQAHDHVRRISSAPGDRRDPAPVRDELSVPRDPSRCLHVVRAEGRGMVRGDVGRAGRGPWPTRVPKSSTPFRPARPSTTSRTSPCYGATPQTVTVGYTPGYYGTVLAPTGVVVYGNRVRLPARLRGAPLVSAAGHVRRIRGWLFLGERHRLRVRGGGRCDLGWCVGPLGRVRRRQQRHHQQQFDSYNHWSSNQVRTNVREQLPAPDTAAASAGPARLQPADASAQSGAAKQSPAPSLDATERHLRRQGRQRLQARVRRRLAATRQRRMDARRTSVAGANRRTSLDRQQQARSYGNWADNVHRARGGWGRRLPPRRLGRLAWRLRQLPRLRRRRVRRRSLRWWRRAFRRRRVRWWRFGGFRR